MSEQLIGKVTHYFSKAQVAAIELTGGELNVGDTVHIVGHTSDFSQKIDSMQVEHAEVQSARPGDRIGIKVVDHAREHDQVYRLVPG
ncbi:MAG TPA: EF-Tu/IF-2/RF-3 family GTPase [Phycisphaerae bacterium]|nr:EF-Tu/IF-2/RF-3 family GTPase [Phycisphaerae bacterium]